MSVFEDSNEMADLSEQIQRKHLKKVFDNPEHKRKMKERTEKMSIEQKKEFNTILHGLSCSSNPW